MTKPSIGVLAFIAFIGITSGIASAVIAPSGSHPTVTTFAAVFLVGVGAVICLYLYAPDRWHIVAGLHRSGPSATKAFSSTTIGKVSGLGAVAGPAIIAAVSLSTGWGKAAIISAVAAALSGFTLALAVLWGILLTHARRSAQ